MALHNGLNSISPCIVPNGLIYTQELLKLASQEEADVLNWLQFNWQSYPYRLTHGLLTQVIASDPQRKKWFKDILSQLDGLYDVPPDDSSMQRLEGKFSSMMRGGTALFKGGPSLSHSNNSNAASASSVTQGGGDLTQSVQQEIVKTNGVSSDGAAAGAGAN